MPSTSKEATFEDHVRAFAQRAAVAAALSTEQETERAAFIVAARYGCSEDGRTLAAIGEALGLTRERVRQIEKSTRDAAAPTSSAANEIRRLDGEIRAFLPAAREDADAHFRRRLGRLPSVADVMRFCHDVLDGDQPVSLLAFKRRRSGARVLVPRAQTADWVEHACRVAGLLTSQTGAAMLDVVAGRVAFDLGVAVSRDALVRALAVHPNFKWLDERGGWFAIDSVGRQALEMRLKKLLSVARTALDFDDVMESLAVEPPRAKQPESPPQPHYRAMLARIRSYPWIDLDIRNRLSPTRPISMSQVLTPVERRFVEAIERGGGSASTGELVAAGMKEEFTENGVRMMIRTSPILRRLDRARYALRGRAPAHPGKLAAKSPRRVEAVLRRKDSTRATGAARSGRSRRQVVPL